MQSVDHSILEDLKNRYNHTIDTRMVLDFIDGLYPELPPGISLETIRDFLSSGQVLSKFWLLDQIKKANLFKDKPHPAVLVAGGWLGLTAYFMNKCFNAEVLSLDIDPMCSVLVDKWCRDFPAIKTVTADMYEFDYSANSFDLIINTSCEHIEDLPGWLSSLKKGQSVLLQANNHAEHDQHINAVESLDDFIKRARLSVVYEAGELKFPMYTRYMIYGQT